MSLRRGRHIAVGAGVGAVLAVFAADAQAAVSVSVLPQAKLVDDGQAVLARVEVSCDPGREVLEAHLTVSQDAQTITGTGGIPGVVCDGRSRRYRVQVRAQDSVYHRGQADASAFVLVHDPSTGGTESAGDSASISVH